MRKLKYFLLLAAFYPLSVLNAAVSSEPIMHLRDIHLPPAVGLWPKALGWVISFGILFISLSAGILYFFRIYNSKRPKKEALALLKYYQSQFQKDKDAPLTAARISELLKRVALVYFPRTQVASLQGDSWVQFLNKTGKGVHFTSVYFELVELPYSPYSSNRLPDIEKLFKEAEKWISQRRKTCLH